MGEENQGWKWWHKAGLAGGLLLFTLVALLIGMRQPWIEPLPGVRTALTRPFVRETDLGPDSAYRLLLVAIEPPAKPLPTEETPTDPAELFAPEPDPETGWPVEEPSPKPAPTWLGDWSDALGKFEHHPWPAEPPPAATNTPKPTSEHEGEGGMFGMDGYGDPRLAPEAPWTLAQYEDIERLVKLYEPQVAILDQALAAPNPQVPTADRIDFELRYLSPTRGLARWLAVSAHYRAAHGDYAGAFKDLERMLGMGNLVCRGGCLINHLVGIACDAIAARASWIIAARHEVPAPVLREAAQAFLAAGDEAEPFVEAMRAEATFGKSAIAMAYRQATLDFGMGGPPAPVLRLGFVLARFTGSTPEATARNMEACYQHLIKIADQPYSAAVQAEYDAFTASLSPMGHDPLKIILRTRDPIGLILASMLLPALDQAHRKAAQRDAMLRGMALFLAIKAYEQERGAPPDTLEQLVPDYLPRVPIDPFDGKPFRYLRNGVPGLPPEAWAVYSIGEDFTDDGGGAHSVGTSQDEDGTNPDLVWPSQGYPPPAAGE